jgi:predicted metalloprotease
VWGALFKATGRGAYTPATLTLYRGAVRSGCGTASSAAGPFYCPADRHVYLDTSFFDELSRRFGAPGDFAQAYVIAHEIGHHVQNQQGTMERFEREGQRLDERRPQPAVDPPRAAGRLLRRRVGPLRAEAQPARARRPRGRHAAAAAAVGDDTIMKRTQGYVVPDAMNHGTAEQRTRWFRAGLQSGDPRTCDTFGAATP